MALLLTGFVFLALSSVVFGGVDENYFYLKSNSSVTLYFNMSSYDITSGEKWEGLSVDGDHILIKANRKNSGEVAAYFENGLNPTDMFPTNNVVDVEPDELNFAVKGNLSIRLSAYGLYDCGSFRLAQGHYTAHNNWWLAFPSGATDKVVDCVNNGQKAKLQFHGIEDDTEYVLPF